MKPLKEECKVEEIASNAPSTEDLQKMSLDHAMSPLPALQAFTTLSPVEQPLNITSVNPITSGSSVVRPDQLQYVRSVKTIDLSHLCSFIKQFSNNSSTSREDDGESLPYANGDKNVHSPAIGQGSPGFPTDSIPQSNSPCGSSSALSLPAHAETETGSSFRINLVNSRQNGSGSCDRIGLDRKYCEGSVEEIRIKEEPADEDCYMKESPAVSRDLQDNDNGRSVDVPNVDCKTENDLSPVDGSIPVEGNSSLSRSEVKVENECVSHAASLSEESESEADWHRMCTYRNKKHPFYRCSFCSREFSKRTSYRKHVCCKCIYCGQIYKDKSAFLYHLQTHDMQGKYSCELCGKQYRDKNSYHDHKQRHSGDHLYSCSICNSSFSVKWFLIRHELSHMGLRAFTCKFCRLVFSFKSTLHQHCQEKHNGGILHHCTMCNRTFSKKSEMSTHLKLHMGHKPYGCLWCPKRFVSKIGLDKHRNAHLDSIAAGLRLPSHHSDIKHVSYSAHLSASVKANLKLKKRLGKGKNSSATD